MKRKVVFSFFMAMLFFVSVVEGAESFCGDGDCQDVLENETSCPQDCVDDIEEGILDGQEGYVTLESGIIVDEEYASDFGMEGLVDSNEQSRDIPFTSSLAFKIILIVIVLIVVGLIGFFIYREMMKNSDIPVSDNASEDNSTQTNQLPDI